MNGLAGCLAGRERGGGEGMGMGGVIGGRDGVPSLDPLRHSRFKYNRDSCRIILSRKSIINDGLAVSELIHKIVISNTD